MAPKSPERNAVIIAGFSEPTDIYGHLSDQLSPADEQLAQSTEAVFDTVDVLTLSNVRQQLEESPDALRKELERRAVITHSAGAIAVRNTLAQPEYLLTLNGPEPTRLRRAMAGAALVSLDSLRRIDDEEKALDVPLSVGEVIRHPRVHFDTAWAVRKFSTFSYLQSMLAPNRKMGYVQSTHDQFPFYDPVKVKAASEYGMYTAALEGRGHSAVISDAELTAQTIHDFMEHHNSDERIAA